MCLDQISKYLTVKYIPYIYSTSTSYPYGGVGVFSDFLGIQFSLNFATNKGAAWGSFSDYTYVLLALRIALILFLFRYFWKLPKNSRLYFPLALIIAGALGNVIDIFFYGHVIDMFHFIFWGYDYPVFNVADSSIFVGIFLYIIMTSFSHDSARATK